MILRQPLRQRENPPVLRTGLVWSRKEATAAINCPYRSFPLRSSRPNQRTLVPALETL
jgi:hypothetical protein